MYIEAHGVTIPGVVVDDTEVIWGFSESGGLSKLLDVFTENPKRTIWGYPHYLGNLHNYNGRLHSQLIGKNRAFPEV